MNREVWPYEMIPPTQAANLAYRGYYDSSGCCIGAFKAIVKPIADHLGEPYTHFPYEMTAIGNGGMAGWRSVCGALNGAAMAIALFMPRDEAKEVARELFDWHEKAELPIFKPEQPDCEYDVPTTVAGSVNCDASTANWMRLTDEGMDSEPRKERCARITADIAGKAVDLLNRKFAK